MAGTVLGAEMEDVILDVMPTLEGILGFTNRWYKDAMRNPMPFTLPNGVKINVIHPVLYIMTKTEAFKSRGNGNYFSSHDFKAALQAHLDAYEDIERSPVVLARFRGMFKDD